MLVMSPLVVLGYYVEKNGCQEYAKILKFEYKHTFNSGCMLNTDQGWIDRDNYVIIESK
jgi:hypothetical protein